MAGTLIIIDLCDQ